MKPMVMCDVDITVVNTDTQWIDYIGEKLFRDNPGESFARVAQHKALYGTIPYDITELFPEAKKLGIDLFDYWRSDNLYNLLTPIEGAVETLRRMSSQFDVVFVSQAKGGHHKSKYNWVNKWFPFHSGVILTKEKWQVARGACLVIDDRLSVLEKCTEYNPTIGTVLLKTSYTQDSDFIPTMVKEGWS